jgi:predicted GNAT superfamily acetyltransferase
MASQSLAVAHEGAEWPITMRRVDGIDEYRHCERLQEVVWGPDDVARVPLLDLLTAQENGGIVLGAFAEDRQGAPTSSSPATAQLVGFVYSFPGLTAEGQLKQCSVLLCVHPDHRGRGLGRQLKLAQRAATLTQGIDLVTWTFDPLLAVNAMLNIRRLGGVAREYRVNLYDSGAGLNAGLETDRLVVDWWLRRRPWPQAHQARSEVAGEAAVNAVARDPRTGLHGNTHLRFDARDPRIRIAIPPDIGSVKRADMALARRWRVEVRELFATYFARGYVVVDFTWPGWPSGHPAYVLQRRRTQ